MRLGDNCRLFCPVLSFLKKMNNNATSRRIDIGFTCPACNDKPSGEIIPTLTNEPQKGNKYEVSMPLAEREAFDQ